MKKLRSNQVAILESGLYFYLLHLSRIGKRVLQPQVCHMACSGDITGSNSIVTFNRNMKVLQNDVPVCNASDIGLHLSDG